MEGRSVRTIQVADLFAGAGGLTTGAYMAAQELGMSLNVVAVNHDPVAIRTHQTNHPAAKHYCASIEAVDPIDAVPSGHLDLLLAAPECIFFANARGGKPVDDQRRSSAWTILRWLERLRVDRLLLENVAEFRHWAPLDSRNKPMKSRRGEVYRAFINALEAFDYRVETRILCAADFGEATTRRRLFVQAVRGRRQRIFWPEPTHTPAAASTLLRQTLPWRAAREVIDWTLPSRSIFDPDRKALVAATLRRIQVGLKRCHGRPFIIPQQSGGFPRSVDKPLPTIASMAAIGLCEPITLPYYSNGGSLARPVSQPLGTITTRDRFLLVIPVGTGDVRYRMLQTPELAAAMGFPSGYEFCGTKKDRCRQIGNAVSRRTAQALVRSMLEPMQRAARREEAVA